MTDIDGDRRLESAEDPDERWNRNYSELLQELRVAQTGVQILFAFLLTLPFSVGFEKINGTERVLYVITFLCSGVAAALLIAPVSYHRLSFREGRKPQIVRTAHVLAQFGLFFEMIAIVMAVYLVVDVVVGMPWAGFLGGGVALIYLLLWYVLPLATKPAPSDD
ncbi:hypothetical protein Cme02nite_67510 [Catellatospora methionotrophica]|uniref:Uncharacterized protein n=1 Tax=Catellatospora methionotrophica TaxID=121620 RepID=A0A8J3LGI5_9ACTN|nr:DUF6328 family protein [Catellatospora methionotrophica]GIG18419.1 hypothetical protein Cme02nite_67510 [Catellatospora methionotrophica]